LGLPAKQSFADFLNEINQKSNYKNLLSYHPMMAAATATTTIRTRLVYAG
jgi:hypothetical protein